MSDDDEQFNPKAHKGLLKAISSLGKTQHIPKITRNEPQIQQSEFTLIKRAQIRSEDDSSKSVVNVNDIVQVLKKTKKHIDAGKQLRNVRNSKKVLQKPLEKPVAERLKRTIGYDIVKKNLARWDAVVAKNRTAETQVFPLKSETIYIDTSAHAKPLQLSVKSDLMRELEATDAKLKALKKEYAGDHTDEADLAKREDVQLQKKLTRDELIARRRELSYLRMRESQQSAKQRQRNKIKSKKFHKALKRQKMLEQIKEFELLQKTNPEAALEKLNELEKNRARERATLRHKNTGTWAKNLQVRAKYDKDVRKDLAEQLQVSRELMQKKTIQESDEDVEDEEKNVEADDIEEIIDPFNPWFIAGKKGAKDAKPEENGIENWRKYWLERNENDKLLDEYKKMLSEEIVKPEKEEKSVATVTKNHQMDCKKPQNKTNAKVYEKTEKNKSTLPKTVQQQIKKDCAPMTKKENKKRTLQIATQKSAKKPKLENGWLVEEIEPAPVKKLNKKTRNIDDIFDAREDALQDQIDKKINKLKKTAERLKSNKTKTSKNKKPEKDELKQLKDLSFKNTAKRPLLDEELNKDELSDNETAAQKALEKAAAAVNVVANDRKTTSGKATTDAEVDAIDPTKLAVIKLKQNINSLNILCEDLGDVIMDDAALDDDVETEKQMTIAQAFEDDDIVADFTGDKVDESKLKDVEIQLSMPGWGSWAGAGISEEEQAKNNRNKRLILKLAPEEKRRDENKGGIYINEEANKALRPHLVSDLPFPFTSVQDYEASIRAPLGRNFVPETAFRMLTRPSVITMKGQIIEPMDESELVKPDRRLRHVVDRRIAKANKAKLEAK